MGVTIFYQGKLNANVQRDMVIDIIQDIAQSLGWSREYFNDKEKDVKGVILNPHPDGESLNFIFAKDGLLINKLMYGWKLEQKVEPIIDSTVKLCFFNTQFTNPATHIAVIKFLIFLKNNYFKILKIEDEGGYYPNNDTEELINRMDLVDKGKDITEGALSDSTIRNSKSELLEDKEIIDRIENILKKMIVK